MTMPSFSEATQFVLDRQARIAELEKELARVRRDIEETRRVNARVALLESAFAKLKREMLQTLTREEMDAVMGAYIFIHRDGIDLVRQIPSGTSRGEDKQLLKDLTTGEKMRELETLTREGAQP